MYWTLWPRIAGPGFHPALTGGCVSLRTLDFSGFRTMEILIAPDFFEIVTIPAHCSVGSSTFGISSILWSSCLTSSRSDRGMPLGVYKENGLAGWSFISYSSPRFSSPWNNFSLTWSLVSAPSFLPNVFLFECYCIQEVLFHVVTDFHDFCHCLREALSIIVSFSLAFSADCLISRIFSPRVWPLTTPHADLSWCPLLPLGFFSLQWLCPSDPSWRCFLHAPLPSVTPWKVCCCSWTASPCLTICLVFARVRSGSNWRRCESWMSTTILFRGHVAITIQLISCFELSFCTLKKLSNFSITVSYFFLSFWSIGGRQDVLWFLPKAVE